MTGRERALQELARIEIDSFLKTGKIGLCSSDHETALKECAEAGCTGEDTCAVADAVINKFYMAKANQYHTPRNIQKILAPIFSSFFH